MELVDSHGHLVSVSVCVCVCVCVSVCLCLQGEEFARQVDLHRGMMCELKPILASVSAIYQ